MTGGTNRPAAGQTEDLLQKVAVAEALRAISAAHREILNETILRGRTVNEAAETLGIPVGTVKTRLYYALRALRLVLAERAVTEPANLADVTGGKRAGHRSVRLDSAKEDAATPGTRHVTSGQ